jgi:hypothetical protein
MSLNFLYLSRIYLFLIESIIVGVLFAKHYEYDYFSVPIEGGPQKKFI